MVSSTDSLVIEHGDNMLSCSFLRVDHLRNDLWRRADQLARNHFTPDRVQGRFDVRRCGSDRKVRSDHGEWTCSTANAHAGEAVGKVHVVLCPFQHIVGLRDIGGIWWRSVRLVDTLQVVRRQRFQASRSWLSVGWI